jgi:flagellar protein FliO/FliZ
MALLRTLLLATQGSSVQDATSINSPIAPIVPDYGAAFFHMLLTFGALLLVVIFTVWIVKKWGRVRFGKSRGNEEIVILEKRILGPKTVLYIIEVDGTKLLIGESQLEIRALHQWPAPESADS